MRHPVANKGSDSDYKVNIFDNIKFLNRLSYLIGILAIFIVLFSCFDYVAENWFRVEKIIIEGDFKNITPQQLTNLAKNQLHGTLFTLDIDDLQKKFKYIPLVKQVIVSRKFPDTIVIYAIEYVVLGKFGNNSVLSVDGKIIPALSNNPNLPVFYSDDMQTQVLIDNYNLLLPILNKHKVSLKKMYLIEGNILKLNLSNNLQITICGNDFARKFNLLNRFWDKFYQIRPNLSYINTCYKNGIAVN